MYRFSSGKAAREFIVFLDWCVVPSKFMTVNMKAFMQFSCFLLLDFSDLIGKIRYSVFLISTCSVYLSVTPFKLLKGHEFSFCLVLHPQNCSFSLCDINFILSFTVTADSTLTCVLFLNKRKWRKWTTSNCWDNTLLLYVSLLGENILWFSALTVPIASTIICCSVYWRQNRYSIISKPSDVKQGSSVILWLLDSGFGFRCFTTYVSLLGWNGNSGT